jgi:hypothetical protein
MTDERIYEGDVGVRFLVSTGIDLTTTTVTQLKVTKGDLSTATWNASVNIDDNTVMEYISVDGDLDVSGKYKLYAYVEFTTDSKHSGRVATFTVYDVFK